MATLETMNIKTAATAALVAAGLAFTGACAGGGNDDTEPVQTSELNPAQEECRDLVVEEAEKLLATESVIEYEGTMLANQAERDFAEHPECLTLTNEEHAEVVDDLKPVIKEAASHLVELELEERKAPPG